MYIAHHIYPYEHDVVYRGTNNQNEENSETQQQASSRYQRARRELDGEGSKWYEIDVTQHYGGEESHYGLHLIVFSSTSMTEAEIVRMACVHIIIDVDGRYINAALNSLSDSNRHNFDKRAYECFAIRLADNDTAFMRSELPPICVYDDNTTQDDPRESVLNSLDNNTL